MWDSTLIVVLVAPQALLDTRYGLRFGNESLGLPGTPSSSLPSGVGSSSSSATTTSTSDSSATASVSPHEFASAAAALQAGDAMVLLLAQRIGDLVLAANRSSAHGVPPVGVNATALAEDELVSSIIGLEQGQVSPLLRQTVDAYLQDLNNRMGVAAIVDYSVTGVTVAVLVVMYLFVFRIAVRTLLHEARRTQVAGRVSGLWGRVVGATLVAHLVVCASQDFLRLLPETVIDNSPVLKKLFAPEPLSLSNKIFATRSSRAYG